MCGGYKADASAAGPHLEIWVSRGMGAEEFGIISDIRLVLWRLWYPKLRYVGHVGKDFGGQRELRGTFGDHLGTLWDQ